MRSPDKDPGEVTIKIKRWVTDLHRFDDGDDARRPEAADGGEHGDGQVVVWRSPIH